MKKVFICSRYAGKVEENVAIAKKLCKKALLEGYAPFAPHLLYPQMLNDKLPEERTLGIVAGHQYLDICDEMWIYQENGISEGMQEDINRAYVKRISMIYVTLDGKP